tara:strand:- start:283 stop:456 length:174 start_codon:yes stop_codon:yes gene_type:complete
MLQNHYGMQKAHRDFRQDVAKKPHLQALLEIIVKFLRLNEGYRSPSIEIHAALAIHC